MTRPHDPCGLCDRFTSSTAKAESDERTGHCSGFDKRVLSTDQPCVLFNERGTWEARKRAQAISRDQFPRDRKVAAKA